MYTVSRRKFSKNKLDNILIDVSYAGSRRIENTTTNRFDISGTQKILLDAISGGVTEFDQIINNSCLNAEQVASQLVQLEIMGLVANVPGGYVRIKS